MLMRHFREFDDWSELISPFVELLFNKTKAMDVRYPSSKHSIRTSMCRFKGKNNMYPKKKETDDITRRRGTGA